MAVEGISDRRIEEMKREQSQADVAWYARPELPGPWRMRACREHGPALERHRFERVDAAGAGAGDPARDAGECALCGHPEFLREVELCTCEYDSARCPAHQNVGCGG
jgi:hypothetical protein